jgi:hypothetical protein
MGVFRWFSTKASNQGSKLKGFARRVSSAEELEKHGQYIVGMAKDVASVPEASRQETFESAYQRLGLSEESLRTTYGYYMFRFNLFLFFGVMGIVLGAWYAFNGSWAALAVLGFLAICVGQLFVASFRMLQIRRRELFPVSYWMSVPRQWWPTAFVERQRGQPNAGHPTNNVRQLRPSSSPRRKD